jgi:hypothetical protein
MNREVHVQFCERAGVRLPCATHLVMGFEHRDDAEQFLALLHQRMVKFGL